MISRITIVLLFVCLFHFSYGQGNVGIGVASPNKNAVLELVSPANNQGLLVPKVTTAQRTATSFTSQLSAAVNGLLVFDTDDSKFYFWQNTAWQGIGSSLVQDLKLTGNTLTITNNATATPIDLSTVGTPNTDGQTLSYNAANGQLSISTLSTPQTVTITPQDLKLTGNTLTITNNSTATPIDLSTVGTPNTDGQTLSYNATTRVLSISTLSTPSTVTITPQDLKLVGNTLTITGNAAPTSLDLSTITVAPSGAAGGDLTGTYPNPTVAANAVGSAEIINGSLVDADISATAAVAVSKLTAGTSGQVLTTSGGIPQWANPSGSVLINNAGVRNLFAGATVGTSSGTDNAYYGSNAGNASTSGNYNVVFGSGAGQNKTAGDLNTLIGWLAGQGTGSTPSYNGNTFVGAQSGQNTTGGPNTFIGEKSGQANTTGTQSLFAGNRAGITNTTGTQNTILGYFADVSSANLQNAIAIGYSTVADASNKVRLGNTAITVIEGQVAFTNASDRRFKTNIKPLASGLDFIKQLNPVSYQMKNSTDTRTNWGFIAQEIQAITGDSNAIVTVGSDQNKTLGLRYTDFTAPLVKAVQEQEREIELLRAALAEKDQKIKALEESMGQMKNQSSDIASIKDQLEKLKKSLGL